MASGKCIEGLEEIAGVRITVVANGAGVYMTTCRGLFGGGSVERTKDRCRYSARSN